MILVIAPTYLEAKTWAREHAEEYNLTPCSNWRYVQDAHDFQGRHGAKFVVLRSYALSSKQINLVLEVRQYLGEGSRL